MDRSVDTLIAEAEQANREHAQLVQRLHELQDQKKRFTWIASLGEALIVMEFVHLALRRYEACDLAFNATCEVMRKWIAHFARKDAEVGEILRRRFPLPPATEAEQRFPAEYSEDVDEVRFGLQLDEEEEGW